MPTKHLFYSFRLFKRSFWVNKSFLFLLCHETNILSILYTNLDADLILLKYTLYIYHITLYNFRHIFKNLKQWMLNKVFCSSFFSDIDIFNIYVYFHQKSTNVVCLHVYKGLCSSLFSDIDIFNIYICTFPP